MKEVVILPGAVFIGNGYLQQSSGDCQWKHWLQYHMYLIREEVGLKNAIAVAYGNRLSTAAKADDEVEGEQSALVV